MNPTEYLRQIGSKGGIANRRQHDAKLLAAMPATLEQLRKRTRRTTYSLKRSLVRLGRAGKIEYLAGVFQEREDS